MWRLALGVVLVIVILWMLKRRSGYSKPKYSDMMNADELSAEFNKAAGEMSAEMEIKKRLPGNESKTAELEAEQKAEYDTLEKEYNLYKASLVKPAEPINNQSAAPAPADVPSPEVNVLPVSTTSETQPVSPPAEISPA